MMILFKNFLVRNLFPGRNLLMEFVYDSADAAGQNAVTVTTWHACQWALDKINREYPDINIREFYKRNIAEVRSWKPGSYEEVLRPRPN